MAQGGRKLDLKKAVALVKLMNEFESSSASASGERSDASPSTSSSRKCR